MTPDEARSVVARAVVKGSLRRLPCEVCGEANAEGHHPDYTKPLDVTWLCLAHHVAEHKRLRKMGIKVNGEGKSKTRNFPLRLSEDLIQQLQELADRERRTMSNLARLILETGMAARRGLNP